MLITDVWNNYVMADSYKFIRNRYFLTSIYAGYGVGVSVNIDNECLNDYTTSHPYLTTTAEVRIDQFYREMMK